MPYSSRYIQGGNLGPGEFRAANPVVASADTDVALLIKYIGSSQSGTVEVSSGDIIFLHGDVGSEASDTTVGNATTGRIDISNAAEDTIAEALPLINQSANWIAVAVDAVGADSLASSALLTMAATQAKTAKGIQILWDTSVKKNLTALVAPAYLRDDIRPYVAVEKTGGVDNMFPFKGFAASVNQFNSVGTGTGADTVSLLSDPDPTGTDAVTVWQRAGAGSTNRNAIDLQTTPVEGARSERILARVAFATTMTAGDISVMGELARKLN